MISEKIKMAGTPTFKLYGPDGVLKCQFTLPNLIVSSGKQWIIGRFSDTPPALMSHIAIGTNTLAPASGNTALGAEVNRVTLTPTYGSNDMRFNATFGPGVGTGSVSEAGVFNNSVGGTMLSRVSFTPFTKAAADTLAIEWVFELI